MPGRNSKKRKRSALQLSVRMKLVSTSDKKMKYERPIRIKLLNACLQFLIPTARFLLRGGISCNEFLHLGRLAFVAAAARDYGNRGRGANSSRIAAVTGMSRREVGRLKKELESYDEDPRTTLSPIGDVLQRWHTQDTYLSESGDPLILPVEGSAPSLESLVAEVISADFPVGVIRSELLRAGLAQLTPDGGIQPLSRQVVPVAAEERLLSALSYGLRGLAETIAHNSDPNRKEPSRIERCVEGPKLNEKNVARARARMRHLVTMYSTAIDDELSELAAGQERGETGNRRVGVGFYYFEE
jgi:hypothetical protein